MIDDSICSARGAGLANKWGTAYGPGPDSPSKNFGALELMAGRAKSTPGCDSKDCARHRTALKMPTIAVNKHDLHKKLGET